MWRFKTSTYYNKPNHLHLPMSHKQLSQLLDKYLSGNCSAEEIAIINQWYAKYESEENVLDDMDDGQLSLLKERMHAEISANITADGHVDALEKVKPVVPLFRRWWVKVAAAAVILLVAKFAFFDLPTKTNGIVEDNEQVYLLNNSAHILKKTFADGSVVWLKPNASLKYPKKFAAASRNVSMNGECFFEIAKDPKHPFIVTSGHMVTKVLGTSFQVVDHNDSREAFVTVVTGKVSVRRKDGQADFTKEGPTATEVTLQPDYKVLYSEDRGELIASKVLETNDLALWKRLSLTFEDEKLTDVAKVLSKNFNVQIQLADASLSNQKMTGNFDGLNLPEVLDVVKTAMKIDYEISGDVITLSKPIN